MAPSKSRLALRKAPFIGKAGGSLFSKPASVKEKPEEEEPVVEAVAEPKPAPKASKKDDADLDAKLREVKSNLAAITAKTRKGADISDVPRIPTGVPGLDELIPGGIPKGSVILVVGGPGSGKSIFSLQFLLNGALKYGEPGAYISMEESEESIKRTGEMFGWDVDDLEKKGLFHVVWRDPYDVKSFAKVMGGQLYYLIKDAGIKRIAFDSITYFTLTEENRFKLRKEIAELSTRLKAVGVTSLFISEVPQAEMRKGRYGMEEFVADGIILLNNFMVRDTHVRAVEVLKMRHTHHDTLLHPFAITKKGLEIYPHELVFKD
jgi:KaiC/GvpD/RAD55 family RecA-like ATPase